ncbi:MAG: sigma 54-interacting transcriptional regulator [Deltaproteobacteria bacterium]|nr:sigma 54-interacting transcriptional regulator [Deltaproteobacteria bacterium]
MAGGWRYKIRSLVGKGATAQVWRATDQTTGEEVALKVALAGSGATQMADEADALLGASLPDIPRLLGLGRVPDGVEGVTRGSPYIALQWLEGEPLDPRALGSAQHRRNTALAVARDIGAALWQLHEAGVAHGDVKPANILVDASGGTLRAKLVDLGFATSIDRGQLRGATPRYLSPEASHGHPSPRGRDLWALGVVLAEIISEQVARAPDAADAMRQAGLAAPFDAWCLALTAPDPGGRPSASWLSSVACEWTGALGQRPDEAWRVRASYLRVRRDELRRVATVPTVEVQEAVAPWFHAVVKISQSIASLRGASDEGDGREVVEPLDAVGRARWLVALVGSAAASWRMGGRILEVPESELARVMEQLASAIAPRAWTLRDLVRALEGETGNVPARRRMAAADDVDLALELGRRPVPPLALEEAERRLQRQEISDRLGLLLADTLRASGEMGRALSSLGKRTDAGACALRAEVFRRMGDRASASVQARAVRGDDPESSERARCVLARIELDEGRPAEALALVDDPRSAFACEVSSLAHLARGDRDRALRDVELGMSLACDEEARARLECVRGYNAHEAGDAEAAHEAYSRAVDHAVRAGAIVEEATYLTGRAAAAVLAGMIGDAASASMRAALLWEHLGRRAQWAYALLARTGALCLAGAWLEARRTAAEARDRAIEAGDKRAELYGWMALCDASEARSSKASEAAQAAWALASSLTDDEDKVRAGARLLASGGLGDDMIRQLDLAASGVGTTGQCEWWGARAGAFRMGSAVGRAPELIGHLARLARQRAPMVSKGPAMHEARLLAEQSGDGDAARVFALEQARLASKLLAGAPAELRDSAALVPWVRGGQSRIEPTVSSDQVRNLESLVRSLARRDSLRSLLEQVLDALVLWTGVERGLLLLRAPDDHLAVRAARNLERNDLRPDQVKLSQSLALRALSTREPVVAVDAAGEISEVHASVHALGLRSVLAVPLLARGEALGVAYLDDRIRAGAFGPQELAWVKLIALVAAVAIADARDQLLLRRAARQAERAQRKLAQTLAQREAELGLASAELARAKEGRETRYRYDALVGRSEPMRAMLQLIDRVTPTAVPVMIVGASGSGKELVARALHHNGPRGSGPFVSENCSAIPETLLESTLFGHVRGAFTSADRNRVGLFEAAHGGTLFLDEIGEMSLSMQSKLLRTLQDGEVHPLGSSRSRKVDVRIITATHRDLSALVQEGRFREDLLYRLNVISIPVPALRERRDDIELLVRHFIGRHGAGRKVKVANDALARLVNFEWPGNVRQLENEVRRALVLCDDAIRVEHLSPELSARASKGTRNAGLDLRGRVDELEKQLVIEALGRTRGNQTQAARLLGLSRFGLQKMVRRLGIDAN